MLCRYYFVDEQVELKIEHAERHQISNEARAQTA